MNKQGNYANNPSEREVNKLQDEYRERKGNRRERLMEAQIAKSLYKYLEGHKPEEK